MASEDIRFYDIIGMTIQDTVYLFIYNNCYNVCQNMIIITEQFSVFYDTKKICKNGSFIDSLPKGLKRL